MYFVFFIVKHLKQDLNIFMHHRLSVYLLRTNIGITLQQQRKDDISVHSLLQL